MAISCSQSDGFCGMLETDVRNVKPEKLHRENTATVTQNEEDETFGRHVRWTEDHESCQAIAVWEFILQPVMGNKAANEFK